MSTMGDTNIETPLDNWGAVGYVVVWRFQAPSSGNIFDLQLYCNINSGSPVAYPVIYDDSGGLPNNLVGSGVAQNVPAAFAWLTMPVTGAIIGGNFYHIGFYIPSTPVLNDREAATGTTTMSYLDFAGSIPNPFGVPTGSFANVGSASIFADYTPLATAGGDLAFYPSGGLFLVFPS
ncbi:MAG: hypothetical protein ABSA75_13490 [Candidatus Bathyarchaeia archaeon]|jgi:hypothetical protein